MPHIEVRDVSLAYDTPAGRVRGVAGLIGGVTARASVPEWFVGQSSLRRAGDYRRRGASGAGGPTKVSPASSVLTSAIAPEAVHTPVPAL